jgi:hypothetical protein
MAGSGTKDDAAPGTVEAFGRDAGNPVGGWYGLRNGYRGRVGMSRDLIASGSSGLSLALHRT